MMKRETLNRKRAFVGKMDYTCKAEDLRQVIDSHLEAYDYIHELEAELDALRAPAPQTNLTTPHIEQP